MYHMNYNSDVFSDIKWIDDQYEILQEKHPEKYIVVKNSTLLVVVDGFDTATRRAKEILGDTIEFTVERIETGDLFVY